MNFRFVIEFNQLIKSEIFFFYSFSAYLNNKV